MDAELQKNIRDFNPHDIGSQALWQRLSRVYPLHEVLDSVPLSDLSLPQLFILSGRVLEEVGRKIRAIKVPKLKNPIFINTTTSGEFRANTDPAGLMTRLGKFLSACSSTIKDGFTPHITTRISAEGRPYYDNDYELDSVIFGLNVTNIRPETTEEEAAREVREQDQAAAAKAERKRKTKEREAADLLRYQELKKKFEKPEKKVKKAKNDDTVD